MVLTKMSLIKQADVAQVKRFKSPRLRTQLGIIMEQTYPDYRVFRRPKPRKPDIDRIIDYMCSGNCDDSYFGKVKDDIIKAANDTDTPINSVGAIWEAIVILYCYSYSQVKWVLPWHHPDLDNFKRDYGFSHSDTGIDGVIKLTNGKYALYQCKFTQQDGDVTREQYLSLIAASHRALVLYPDDFSTTILFTTKDRINMNHNTLQHTTHLHVWVMSSYYSKVLLMALDLVLVMMKVCNVHTAADINAMMLRRSMEILYHAMPIYSGNIVSPKRDVSLLYDDSRAKKPTTGKRLSRVRAMGYVEDWEKEQQQYYQ